MRLLLISNSTNAGEGYLEYPLDAIRRFLGKGGNRALFIPWAGVSISWDDYEQKVKDRFKETGNDIISIHHFDDPVRAVNEAEAIVVGGGNTFRLAQLIHDNNLTGPVRSRVLGGTPYIGWSAGANVACPTICTTNDMPIVSPSSFGAFNIIKFQINPHYLDANPDGHAGETREMRISEYIELNRDVWVTGLREGTMFLIDEESVELIGPHPVRIFRYGKLPVEMDSGSDFRFLMQ